jgi:hypothetical protein
MTQDVMIVMATVMTDVRTTDLTTVATIVTTNNRYLPDHTTSHAVVSMPMTATATGTVATEVMTIVSKIMTDLNAQPATGNKIVINTLPAIRTVAATALVSKKLIPPSYML